MPTASNMKAIQTVTVGAGGASNIVFTSIPQTYTDLMVVLSTRCDETSITFGQLYVAPNNATTNLTSRVLYGDGTNVGSQSYTTADSVWTYTASNQVTANAFGSASFYFPNYTSSNNKSISIEGAGENNGTEARSSLTTGLWTSSSAITSLNFYVLGSGLVSRNFLQYSTATLYGITSVAQSGTKATGGAIYEDNTYFYHVFGASGTFTPTQSISADILVVAGGGGGYPDSGTGGAGAGGLLGFSAQSLSATNYTITVGAGGGTGSNGSNSQFQGLTACIGGGASNARGSAGSSGGSGGGGSSTSSGGGATVAGGSGTAGQGNAGGSGQHTSGVGEPGGGGGGAGAAGENGVAGSSTLNGDGGIGVSTYSSWGVATGVGENSSGTYYLAGGGPGFYSAVGGLGGGGTSSTGRTGTRNGLVGTGGGGGSGQAGGGAAGTGGSGVVIVRYAK
jgi:hypothetical protein